MRRLVRSVLLAAAILVTGCLAAACVQSASGAVTASSPSASAPATVTAPPSPTPSPPSPTPSPASPTVAPSTAAPTTPASSSPASSGGFSFNLIWLWVILGAAALVVIIVLATRSPGGSDEAVLWRSRTAHTYEQGGAFDNAVREGERQGAYLDRNGAAWHHIQNRAHDLTEALYILREEALTERQRAQVEDALAAMQAVRYALDAEGAPGAASAQQSETLHARLAALESSLNALRVPNDPL
jgi:ABC-type transport system substrate-binding protein